MNVLFTQIAALTGLFVFINQMWTYASLEKSIFLAFGSSIAVYLVLVVGDFAIRAILEFKPSRVHEQEHAKRPPQKTETERNATASHRA